MTQVRASLSYVRTFFPLRCDDESFSFYKRS
jgi:hypothetical protein